jgi:O-antigen/teichoic acid export membrane protein
MEPFDDTRGSLRLGIEVAIPRAYADIRRSSAESLVKDPVEHHFPQDDRPLFTVARNVSTRWLAILVETLLGLVMLPFNVSHLGTAAYGLWILTASITVHFSVLNLGFGGALVKFVAQYRAHKDARALNEIASTLFFVFVGTAVVAYAAAAVLAFNMDAVFRLTPEQAQIGRTLLLIIAIHVALNFPFSVYGGIVSGFQRYHVNSGLAIGSAVLVATVNVLVLTAGYGLVTLVAATTTVRVIFYFIYRLNALRIYPALAIRWSLVRRERLREVTGFSVYALIIDWANKLNYQFDTLVIGAFLGPAPVAIWAAASRIILGTQTLTNQLNGVLFPLVVDSDASRRNTRLRQILLQGTQLSLVMVLPIAAALLMLGDSLIRAWVGPQMLASVPVLQILALAVAIRVGNGTATTLLKGAGGHRRLAWINLAAGVGNVILSIILVLTFGLPGVAFATLLAVTATAAILSPAACHRVELPLTTLVRRAVVPALWPAFVLAAALYATRPFSAGGRLSVVMLHSAAGGLFYLLLFFFVAIRRRDRAAYLRKAEELLGRRRPVTAAEVKAGTSPSAAA